MVSSKFSNQHLLPHHHISTCYSMQYNGSSSLITCEKQTIESSLSHAPPQKHLEMAQGHISLSVFPRELPGMPPERKVEFAIELIPCTAPISKRAYRVSGPELVELNKQIDELLEKGYIRSSTLPWAAPMLFVEKKD
jgi:hypothetical protein